MTNTCPIGVGPVATDVEVVASGADFFALEEHAASKQTTTTNKTIERERIGAASRTDPPDARQVTSASQVVTRDEPQRSRHGIPPPRTDRASREPAVPRHNELRAAHQTQRRVRDHGPGAG